MAVPTAVFNIGILNESIERFIDLIINVSNYKYWNQSLFPLVIEKSKNIFTSSEKKVGFISKIEEFEIFVDKNRNEIKIEEIKTKYIKFIYSWEYIESKHYYNIVVSYYFGSNDIQLFISRKIPNENSILKTHIVSILDRYNSLYGANECFIID